MSRCLHCDHMDLKAHLDHARLGFGRCKQGMPGKFVSVNRQSECADFNSAATEVIRKRDEWMKSRQKGR